MTTVKADRVKLTLCVDYGSHHKLIWGENPCLDREKILYEYEDFDMADHDALAHYLVQQQIGVQVHDRWIDQPLGRAKFTEWHMMLSETQRKGLVGEIQRLIKQRADIREAAKAKEAEAKASQCEQCDKCARFITFSYCACCGKRIEGRTFSQAEIIAAILDRIKLICSPAKHVDDPTAAMYKRVINGRDNKLAHPGLFKLAEKLRSHARYIEEDLFRVKHDDLLGELNDRLEEPIFIFGGQEPKAFTASELEKYFPRLAEPKAVLGTWFDGCASYGWYSKICCLVRTLVQIETYI